MSFARPLRPGIAVRMEGDAFNAEPFAALRKFRRAILAIDREQIREERAGLGQPAKNFRTPFSEPDQWRFDIRIREVGQLFPVIADGPVAPVNILRLEAMS